MHGNSYNVLQPVNPTRLNRKLFKSSHFSLYNNSCTAAATQNSLLHPQHAAFLYQMINYHGNCTNTRYLDNKSIQLHQTKHNRSKYTAVILTQRACNWQLCRTSVAEFSGKRRNLGTKKVQKTMKYNTILCLEPCTQVFLTQHLLLTVQTPGAMYLDIGGT